MGHNLLRIGFLINPVAGMGGRVGLKGTDDLADAAARLGARPVAAIRAREALEAYCELCRENDRTREATFVTCSGSMGHNVLVQAGFEEAEVVYHASSVTGAEDTKAAVEAFLAAGVDLVLFCGGDGTARDVCAVTGLRCPILGIPSGVKMYSGVFGMTPARTAEILAGFVGGRLSPVEVELLDLDEEKYRHGEWAVRLYQTALTPFEPNLTQVAKQLVAEYDDIDARQDIADYMREEIEGSPATLYLLGPGGTMKKIGDELGEGKTLLGVDGFSGGRYVGRDLNERALLALVDEHSRVKLVLSPIGAQGFVIGRGNLQISPAVIRRIGSSNLVVVATPAKLARTPILRVDTGDAALDAELAARGFLSVVTGYRRHRLVKIVA